MINWSLIISKLPLFWQGLNLSLAIACLSCLIGLIVGIPFGIILTSRLPLRYPVSAYVLVVRGTPMLIQIFFFMYGLPHLGIRLAPFWYAVLAIGFNSAAYVSQIVRSGIQAIQKGQTEAAHVLGLSRIQAMFYIILPQALRITFPAFGNEFVNLIKDSSLASTIGVMELTRTGQIAISSSYDALTIYAGIGICYLVVTSSLTILLHLIEKRMNLYVKN